MKHTPIRFQKGIDNLLSSNKLSDEDVLGSIVTEYGYKIARVWADCPDAEEWANRLVKAYNAHDDLVKALTHLSKAVSLDMNDYPDLQLYAWVKTAVDDAKAILQRIEH